MGKYEGLGNFLKKEGHEVLELTFSEIEDILGFPLPKSAYVHRPWWANDENHVQARDGWLSAGYTSQAVDIISQKTRFKRVGIPVIKSPNIDKSLGKDTSPADFERFAQLSMSKYYGVDLSPGKKEEWPKLFDMVSPDDTVVGDAKYLSMVRGQYLPPAKLSVIAEHVWMLEKIEAPIRFLVFGNDRRVPEEWLKRYGHLNTSVEFFFLSNDGVLRKLNEG